MTGTNANLVGMLCAAAMSIIFATGTAAWAQDWVSVPDPLARVLDETAGPDVPVASERMAQTRVVNGIIAKRDKYLFVVALAREAGPGLYTLCGGAQISPEWVLTAAHCVVDHKEGAQPSVTRASRIKIRLGHDRIDADEVLSVIQVIPHPEYNRHHQTYNDIALVRVSNPKSRPVVGLPPSTYDPAARTTVHIVGWGKIGEAEGAQTSKALREAQTELVSRQECQDTHRRHRQAVQRNKPGYVGNGPIDATRICAEVSRKGRPVDSCQGDSGGPLLAQTANGFVAVGIVSYGYGCARPGLHGVYTNVAHYRTWIDKTIGANATGNGLTSSSGGNFSVASGHNGNAVGGGGLGNIGNLPTDAPLSIRVKGGNNVQPGASLVFEIISGMPGELLIFDSGSDGKIQQIFPNYRTKRARIPTVVRMNQPYSTPTSRHGYSFRAPTQIGSRNIFAMVTPTNAPISRPGTRGLAPVEDPEKYSADAAASLKKKCATKGSSCAIGVLQLNVK